MYQQLWKDWEVKRQNSKKRSGGMIVARILIIEDDVALRNQVADMLRRQQHEVIVLDDFNHVEEVFKRAMPELVILDINLPTFDGNYYCRIFRRHSNVPIIITSARNSDSDQILGMELGADEYIVKPYNVQILLAKINTILRRTLGEYADDKKQDSSVLYYDGVQLNENGFSIQYQGKTRELSKNEYRLLKRLMMNPGQVVSREELLEELWDDISFVDDNTLTVNVTRVKKILAEIYPGDIIKTKRGAGYYISRT
jgi:DNA-binding response OmpR family regulator